MPIKIQTQISDTVKSFIDKKSKKYLEQYETVKFDELHSAILKDDGDPAIKDNMQMLENRYERSNEPVDNKRNITSSKTMPSNNSLLSFSEKRVDFEEIKNKRYE